MVYLQGKKIHRLEIDLDDPAVNAHERRVLENVARRKPDANAAARAAGAIYTHEALPGRSLSPDWPEA